MIMAGASAVEVGAALFGDFKVLENIHEGLLAAAARWNVASLAELIGRARRA